MYAIKSKGFRAPPYLVLFSGSVMTVALAAIAALPTLRGPTLKPFLVYFISAAAAYAVAVTQIDRARPSLRAIWAFAVLFRLVLLLRSPPTLSDDVYRYIWDGRLANAGVNPYAHAVDSPLLDRFDSPQRAWVNNDWMASPYLPAAQLYFAAIYRLAPDNPFAFQLAAVLLDLLTGWLIVALLRRLGLPPRRALIYLWNPLVIVEFAHGAHVDALMLCLMMLALWGMMNDGFLSPIALAAATVTKGIPGLLLPVVAWRWGWRRTLLYGGLVIVLLVPFALGAGWGLTGPRDGEGLFGALRIYGARWNYNGGLYHWLEVALSGYRTPGAVPPEIVGEGPIRAAKLMMGGLLGAVLLGVAWKARRRTDDLTVLRLAAVPLAAYLLLTTTVHPWYATVIIPFLPFNSRLWPWLYFSAAVALSYLTYLDPANLRETDWVRLVEYAPLYLMLCWSVRPARAGVGAPAAD